jgi:serine/threonine protein kinase/tetratricopeptide (TPR) repeat protein
MDKRDDNPEDPTISGGPAFNSNVSTWSELQRHTRGETPRPLPDWIGEFRILGKLGEGGMGVVYEAEQQNPLRPVALKVIRGGVHLDETQIRMFEREADTLGRLKHPNIAAIYSSGRTEEGFPFYAMELARGRSLFEFIRDRPGPITPEELELRLRLFRKICDAVHYAHQRGVIHRDLKPSNVQITDMAVEDADGEILPEPKVLDFGLARLIDSDPQASMATEVGILKGTLHYMSPEQAQGQPELIDLRTDVYALGIILYEMLSGRLPHDFDRTTLIDAVQKIVHETPAPLSQVWTGARKLDPDLDTILGKALEKDADRRYDSAYALSEDLHRYLTSQPILARRASTMYQLRKFAKRNKILVGGIVATLLTLVAGVVVSTTFGLREARERRIVEQTRQSLQEVVNFQADMINRLDPEETGRRMVESLREEIREGARRKGLEGNVGISLAALDRALQTTNTTDFARRVLDENLLAPAVATVEDEFRDQPKVRMRLYRTLGMTYRSLGLREPAERYTRTAYELSRSDPEMEPLERARCALEQANSLSFLGDPEAESFYIEAIEEFEANLDPDDPELMVAQNRHGSHLYRDSQYERASVIFLDLLERQSRTLGEDNEDTLRTMTGLAGLYIQQRDHESAMPLLQKIYELRLESLGERDPLTIAALGNMVMSTSALGHHEQALAYSRRAADLASSVLGDSHPTSWRLLNTLSGLLRDQNKFDEAIAISQRILHLREEALGELHPQTLVSMNSFGYILMTAGRHDEAGEIIRSLVARSDAVYPVDHPKRGLYLHTFGEYQMKIKDWSAARQTLASAIEIYRINEDRYLGLALLQHAQSCARSGAHTEAIRSLQSSRESGHLSRPEMLEDDAFQSLQRREDFKALVASLST